MTTPPTNSRSREKERGHAIAGAALLAWLRGANCSAQESDLDELGKKKAAAASPSLQLYCQLPQNLSVVKIHRWKPVSCKFSTFHVLGIKKGQTAKSWWRSPDIMKGAGKINFPRLLSIEGRGGRALKVEPRKTNKQRDPIWRRSHRNVTIRYVIYMMGNVVELEFQAIYGIQWNFQLLKDTCTSALWMQHTVSPLYLQILLLWHWPFHRAHVQ